MAFKISYLSENNPQSTFIEEFNGPIKFSPSHLASQIDSIFWHIFIH